MKLLTIRAALLVLSWAASEIAHSPVVTEAPSRPTPEDTTK